MIALLLALLVSSPQQPARDAPRPSGTRAAAISGRVLSADGMTPLRRAIVRLSSSALPRRLTVRADLQGRYAFPELPAGRYTVAASKPGYLALEYGQRRPFEAGRRIELGAAERLTRVDILLPASASITGVVSDETGERVNQMWVTAVRHAYRNGRRSPISAAYTVTNDIGEFRLSGLAPGDYYIVTRQRDARVDEFSEEPIGYGTTLYPGVSTLAAAQPDIGEPRTAGDRSSACRCRCPEPRRSPASRRRDRPADGGAAGQRLTDGPDIAGLGGLLGGTLTDASGAFRMASVRPGIYALVANNQQQVRGRPGGGPRARRVRNHASSSAAAARSADASSTPAGPPGPKAGLIQLCALGTGTSRCAAAVRASAPDGSFTWAGVRGARLVRANGMPEGWWLKAVRQGDRDITDVPLHDRAR